ncbi:MAG TPA: sugar ABC transporter substrate-binding protein [Pseudonocardiaceae bacterium]
MRIRSQSRRLAAVALAATTALVVAGCGDDAAEPGENTAQSGAGKTLTVWIMEGTNPDATPFFDQVKSEFKSKTGADVNIQFVPWSAAKDKFTAAVGGGETPDVAEVGTTWTPEFGEAGILTDLTDKVKGSEVGDDLVASLQTAAEVDGKLYGMPWYAGVRSVLYRTDVFEELGLEPPTNWQEWLTVAQAIKAAKPEMVAMPVAGDNEYGVYPFVWGAGGEIASEENGKWTSGLDSAEARRGIQFYTDLALKHGLSSPAAATWKETDLRDQFGQGKLAMMISGSWTPKAIVEKAPDLEGKIGAFPIPGEKGGISPSFVGGSHLSVFEASENQDLAWQFVQLMTTGKFANEWATQSSFFPGLNSLLEEVTAKNDPLVAPFATQMKDGGETVPVTPAYGKVQSKKTVPAMLQAILSGSKTVEQATADAAAEMTAEMQG